MRAGLEDDPAGPDFFVVRKEAGFDDDLDRPFGGGLDDIAQFAQNIGVVAILETADIHDHIDLLRVVVDGGFGFKPFCVGVGRPEWETDDRCHFDVAAIQKMTCLNHPRSVHANGVEAVLASLVTEFPDILERGVRLEQRVVDVRGEVRDELQVSESAICVGRCGDVNPNVA